MSQTILQAVPSGDREGAVDSWVLPTNLPANVAILPRRFKGERFWLFDLEQIQLLPASMQVLSETVSDYESFPVLVYNHLCWLLENQQRLPEAWREYKIYFPSDRFFRIGISVGFVYMIHYKDGDWIKAEARLDEKPAKGNGKFITMR